MVFVNSFSDFPVLFISHGPPLVGIRPCPAHYFLKELGKKFPQPKAILAISAHWESTIPIVTLGKHPGILYDFGGPNALRQMVYKAPGAPWLADNVLGLLQSNGFEAKGMKRGLDHGTWIPLMLMYPKGGIPTVQLSIQTDADTTHHYLLGRALSTLRQSGVLVLASGGAVHNLEEANVYYGIDSKPPDYALMFDRWLEEKIAANQKDSLLDYQLHAPEAERCHPFPHEHLLPLYVAMGAAEGAQARRLHGSFLFGTLSMASYVWK